jgi:hypothetical protein
MEEVFLFIMRRRRNALVNWGRFWVLLRRIERSAGITLVLKKVEELLQ